MLHAHVHGRAVVFASFPERGFMFRPLVVVAIGVWGTVVGGRHFPAGTG